MGTNLSCLVVGDGAGKRRGKKGVLTELYRRKEET
jgi:hypothetical protein